MQGPDTGIPEAIAGHGFSVTFRQKGAEPSIANLNHCRQIPSNTEGISLGTDSNGCSCKFFSDTVPDLRQEYLLIRTLITDAW